MTVAAEALFRAWRCTLHESWEFLIPDVVLKGLVAFAVVHAEIAAWSCLLSIWKVRQSDKDY